MASALPDFGCTFGAWSRTLALVLTLLTSVPANAQTSGALAISGTPPGSVTAGTAYLFTPTLTVPSGQSYQTWVENLPRWASFDWETGQLSGTPAATDVGTYAGISIRLMSGQTVVALPAFTIEVRAPNRAPLIGGTPAATATVGSSYSFRPTASDPDGDTLSFRITNKPAWASFSTVSGRLYGTPGSTRVGTYAGIVISVTDGVTSTALPPFTITVAGPNAAPVIGGTPPTTATVGRSYSFRPTASDLEGDALTFSIVNKPAWASFTTSSGRLYGTPGSTRVGTYTDIRISVSDGRSTVTLPAFSITVAASEPAAGTATVSWKAPTTHEDGTPLLNLAGFRVVYGTSAAALSEELEIPSPVVTSAVIEGLPRGTWYFAVKAYTTAGVESDLSAIPYKIIP